MHRRARGASRSIRLHKRLPRTLDRLLVIQPKECRCAHHIVAQIPHEIEDQAVLFARVRAQAHPAPDHLRKQVLRLRRPRQQDAVDWRDVGAFREDRCMSHTRTAVDQHGEFAALECLEQFLALGDRNARVDAARIDATRLELVRKGIHMVNVHCKHQRRPPCAVRTLQPRAHNQLVD